MNALDMSTASNDTVVHQAMITSSEIKNFFQQIKINKLQLLHDSEALGSREEQLEQEQGQQEHASQLSTAPDDDDNDEITDEFLDSTKDLFESDPLYNSVLQELEEDEEDSDSNEFQESDIFQ